MEMVNWSKVIGIEQLKEDLQEGIIDPLSSQIKGQLPKWRSIFLYGVPGSGKTYLTCGIWSQVPYFRRVSIPELVITRSSDNKSSGDQLKEYFNEVIAKQPSVIFLDDLDVLYSDANRPEYPSLINPVLHKELNGIIACGDRVVVIAASARPWVVDSNIIGRFEKCIYLPLPPVVERMSLIKHYLSEASDITLEFPINALEELGPLTGGYSPAALNSLVGDVLKQSVRKILNATHFKKATGPNPISPGKTVDDLLIPCSSSDTGAIEMTWENVPEDKFSRPTISLDDFKISLSRRRAGIDEVELLHLQTFTIPPPSTP